VALGASLHLGYFAQAHEDLRPERTLMQEVAATAPDMLPGTARDYLARFLFSGDEVFKKVSTLSGGERGRLALAKLSLTQANLLLLDEPTNHLDIPSQEILQEVLADYQGTILLVSHDRYLIDALGSQIWEIIPGEAMLQVFEGSYTQYKDSQKQELEKAGKVELAQAPGSRKARPQPASAEEKRRRQRLRNVEEEIANLERKLAILALRLENPPGDLQKVQKLGTDYTRLQAEIELLMEEWEQLHEAGPGKDAEKAAEALGD
jgi:ATP-binding cassette subfamily F protein 3